MGGHYPESAVGECVVKATDTWQPSVGLIPESGANEEDTEICICYFKALRNYYA